MPKQLNQSMNVNLKFSADTAQAKRSIEELQNSLRQIGQMNFGKNNFYLTKEMTEASQAANKLTINLREAVNVNTGKLDLTKFSESMKRSGTTLQEYREKLSALGPEGEQAFIKLAQSITNAEIPLKRTGTLLNEFKTTLMNTARWQLSSSVLHGFMGAVSGAYNYAKDLNESLNNIRIVTGYSTDQMATFADQANKAAKALSATTTEYTNASLIYYQQGLSDEEVKARADTTIKLANVSRQSAEEVSDQLTAIWNNFAEGSSNLEYYADVITALGAATASSSEEISTGLEKFAAVSKTVGLSYEYATAALATITATTRQSADTVGTGLRTVFSRLESLKLGETLEDGVDLNKYSAALKTIGVDILDVNGQLKDMDMILNETAGRWDTLDRTQKIAFASTVGGVRQYTTLISLLDNWDFMEENLEVARKSAGTLAEQSKIYQESWEAASKRVKASAQSIYQDLLNDKFFITLNNLFSDALDGLDTVIDKMGGLKGVLVAIGAILLNVYQKELSQAMSNMAYRVSMITGIGRKAMIKQQEEANKQMTNMFVDQDTNGGRQKASVVNARASENQAYIKAQDRMTASQREFNKLIMEQNDLLMKGAMKAAEEADALEKYAEKQKKILDIRLSSRPGDQDQASVNWLKTNIESLEQEEQKLIQINDIYSKIEAKAGTALKLGNPQELQEVFQTLELTDEEIEQIALHSGVSTTELQNWFTQIREGSADATVIENVKSALELVDSEIIAQTAALGQHKDEINQNAQAWENEKKILPGIADQVNRTTNAISENVRAQSEAKIKTDEATESIKRHTNEMQKGKVAFVGYSQGITQVASAMMSFVTIINQVKSMISVLTDESSDASDKIMAIVTTVAMVIPMILGSVLPAIQTIKVSLVNAGTSAQLAFGWISAIMLAITAVAAGVALLLKGASRNTLAEQLETAKKAAESAADQFEKIKKTAQDLRKDLSNYREMRNGLDKLTEGSSSWREQMEKVGAATKDLIEKYPILAKMASKGQIINGQLVYSDKEVEEMEALINASEAQSGAVSLFANKQLYAAEANNAKNGSINIEGTLVDRGYYLQQKEYLGSIEEDITGLALKTNDAWADWQTALSKAVDFSPELYAQDLYNERIGSVSAQEGEHETLLDQAPQGWYETIVPELEKSGMENAFGADLSYLLRNYGYAYYGATDLPQMNTLLQSMYDMYQQKDLMSDEDWQKVQDYFTNVLLNKVELSVEGLESGDYGLGHTGPLSSTLENTLAYGSNNPYQNDLDLAYQGTFYALFSAAQQDYMEKVEAAKVLSPNDFMDEAMAERSRLYGIASEKYETYSTNNTDLTAKEKDKETPDQIVTEYEAYIDNIESTEKTKLKDDIRIYLQDMYMRAGKTITSGELETAVDEYFNNMESWYKQAVNDFEDAERGTGYYDSDKVLDYFNSVYALGALDLDATQFKDARIIDDVGTIEYTDLTKEGKDQTQKILIEDLLNYKSGFYGSQDIIELAATAWEEKLNGFTTLLSDKANKEETDENIKNETTTQMSKIGETLLKFGNLENLDIKTALWALDKDNPDSFINILENFTPEELTQYNINKDELLEKLNGEATDIARNIDIFKLFGLDEESIGQLSIVASNSLLEVVNKLQLGPQGKEAAQSFIDGFNQITENATPQEVLSFLNNLKDVDFGAEDLSLQISQILNTIGIDLSMNKDEWDSWIYKIKTIATEVPSFDHLKTSFNEAMSIISSIDFDDTISQEDFEKLVAFDARFEKFFNVQADGTLRMTKSFKEAKDIVLENVNETIDQLDIYAEHIEAVTNNAAYSDIDWDNFNLQGKNPSMLLNTIKDDEDMMAMIGDQFSKDYITEMQNNFNSDIPEIKALGEQQIQALFTYISNVLKTSTQGLSIEFQYMLASTATNLEELEALKDQIGDEAYQAQFDILKRRAIQNASTMQELQTAVELYQAEEEEYFDKEKEIAVENLNNITTLSELEAIGLKYNIKETEEYINKKKELGLSELNEISTIEELEAIREKYGLTIEDCKDKILEYCTSFELMDQLKQEGLITDLEYIEQVKQLTDEMWQSAQTLQDLDDIRSELAARSQDNSVKGNHELLLDSLNRYSVELIRLGESYEHATLETYNYKEAQEDLDRAIEEFGRNSNEAKEALKQLEESEDELRAAITAAEGASKYGFDAKVIENQAKAIRDLNDDYEMSAEEATQLAIVNQRMNKGVATLNKNFEDWRKTLESTESASQDYAEALTNVESAIADLIGAADDFDLPSGFLEMPGILDMIQAAANGDTHAINELGVSISLAQVRAMEMDESFVAAFDDLDTMAMTFDSAQQVVVAGIDNIVTNLDALLAGTMTIDEAMNGSAEDWVEALNQMALATGMSVDQMNGLLNQLGIQAKVDVHSVKQDMEVPTYDEYETISRYEPAQYETDDEGKRVLSRPAVWHKRTWTVPGEPMKVEGYAQVAQISTEDNPITPSINYVGTGGTSAKAPGGPSRGGGVAPSSTPPKSPSKSPSGGKGSGDKGNKGETRNEKHKDDEAERYHLINSQIDQQTYKLDRLSKAKDRAWGKNKLKAMDAELQALANLGAMYEKHAEASQGWLDTDKAALDTFLQQHGGVVAQYGSDGSILNYRSLFEANLAAYNGAVDAYNNGAIEKEGLENAQKQYEEFQKLLKNYEDSLKQHQDDVDQVVENAIKQYDALTAKNQARIEMRLEFDEYSLDLLDKFINRLETWAKSPFNGAATLAQLNEKTGQLLDKNETLMFGLDSTLTHFLKDYEEFDENGAVSWATGKSDEEVKAFLERYHNNELTEDDLKTIAHLPEEEAKLLKDYTEQLQENSDALIGTADEVVQAVVSVFDTTKEEMEEASKPIERAAEALDNYSQIIDIVGQDYLGISDDMMTAMGQMDISIKHTATAAAREIMETLTYQRDQVQGLMNSAIENGNLELAEKYRQELKGINDDVQEATENFHQAWRDELSAAREEFEKAVDRAKEAMLDGFAGPNNTWRQLKDSFDYAKEAADRYVPQYKEIYELSKLNRDINKSIDDTDNIKNKQALRDLQKEINKLEENSGKISQYDLDNARRRYELELARLQLEEAGNMKDIVRLSKDSEGNWSYIYTANEEDVAAAEQNYEDKLYAMQEANSNYINELQDQIIQAEEAYAEKVAEIMKDNTLSEEQRQALLLAAREQFDETMQYYGGELDKAINNNKELYDKDWTWYANYTARKAEQEGKITDDGRTQLGYRLGDQEKYVDDFNETMLGVETGYNTLDGYNQAVAESVRTNTNKMNQDFQLWQNNTEAAMQGAGTSVETFGEDMEVAGVKVTDFLDKMREAGYGADEYTADISELSTELTDDFIPSLTGENGALAAIKKFGEDGRKEMDATVEKAEWWREEYAKKIGSEDDPNSILGQNKKVADSLKNVLDYVSQFEPDPDITITYDIIEPKLPELPTEHHIQVIYDTTGGTPAAPSGGGGGGGGTTPTGGGGGGGGGAPATPTQVGTTWVDNGDGQTHSVYAEMSNFTRKKVKDEAHAFVNNKCSRCGASKPATGGGGGGCFAPGTQILMADGITTKSIETIKLGEKILSYNEELDIFEAKTVTWVYFRLGYNQLMRLYLSNGQIIDMTLGHPVYTLDGWKSKDIEMSLKEHQIDVELLSEEDTLLGYQEQISILDLQYFAIPNNQIVYCLGIEDNHTFIANGIIVHNIMEARGKNFNYMRGWATGGYTGSWVGGSEIDNGRWALLHQKELVLNEDDTRNILSAVDMVRGFSQAIDQYASTSQFALGNLSAAYSINASKGTLEQMVHITAEFPAATNRGEIEAAFETLINQASQYANRERF